ncbi:MerR family transcriptional regulator [Kribbella sandramycini]|uniref:DNA-binding transcriptional MerR regulator n=1 Tax=Kribbella sandramycini TaxID=60450 RepID=A0A7Y4KZW2_9ACTN|nr:MerR family transcriptional regulator [Kribbella sandramycini]MBB6569167.1 DNA-binding transcriptional MerR regulator [Kribbella sandramycini]NOL40992.1 MerR family transcriptional regulator [Kribbella sandramycini]
MGLRPVDLARRAGISTQLVRNYEADGILPPAPRTDSGYRQYGEAHLTALLTYRALAPGFGAETARYLMQAVHAGDEARAYRLIDQAHANLYEQRLATDAASEALGAAAAEFQDEPIPAGPALLVGELAHRLGVRTSALRVWEAAGLLAPTRERITKYRRYEPEQIRDARIIHMLRQGRYSFDQIRPVLEGLRQTGSTEALRAAIAERRSAHDHQTKAMLHGAGLLHHLIQQQEPPTPPPPTP